MYVFTCVCVCAGVPHELLGSLAESVSVRVNMCVCALEHVQFVCTYCTHCVCVRCADCVNACAFRVNVY